MYFMFPISDGYNKSYVIYKWDRKPFIEFRKLSQFDVKDVTIAEEEADYKAGMAIPRITSFLQRMPEKLCK